MKNKIFILLALSPFIGGVQASKQSRHLKNQKEAIPPSKPNMQQKKRVIGQQSTILKQAKKSLKDIKESFDRITNELVTTTMINEKAVPMIRDLDLWDIYVNSFIHQMERNKEETSKKVNKKSNAWKKYLKTYNHLSNAIKNKQSSIQKASTEEAKKATEKEVQTMLQTWETIKKKSVQEVEERMQAWDIVGWNDYKQPVKEDEQPVVKLYDNHQELQSLTKQYNKAIKTLQSYQKESSNNVNNTLKEGIQTLSSQLSSQEIQNRKKTFQNAHKRIVSKLQKSQLNLHIENTGQNKSYHQHEKKQVNDRKTELKQKYKASKELIENELAKTAKFTNKQLDISIVLARLREAYEALIEKAEKVNNDFDIEKETILQSDEDHKTKITKLQQAYKKAEESFESHITTLEAKFNKIGQPVMDDKVSDDKSDYLNELHRAMSVEKMFLEMSAKQAETAIQNAKIQEDIFKKTS